MPAEPSRLSRRPLRLASGAALCLATSFGLGWSLPVVAPVLGLFVIASLDRPLPLKAGLGLALVVMLTTGSGLLLLPFLRYYWFSGVLLTGLLLFLAFRYGLRGGNNLVSTFLAAGLTMISAAGTADFGLAVTVIGALVKGLLLAVLALAVVHWLFPEPAGGRPARAAQVLPHSVADWMALRAALVVMPAFLLALSDPAAYLPIIMKSVSLGRQSCTTARGAARELLGSTLFGGLLAILFWSALSLFVHLWMFFLWMLLFVLVAGRKLYAISPTRYPPGFWLNSLVTMVILLGQSVQDSAAGKDVFTAFAVRMGLFVGVTLYACLMLWLMDKPGRISLRAP
ncbi:membrane protein [Burkholderiaceae bacterium 16]|nr:membrane protein [Burkholderiaceae bacterium 16]